MSTVIPTIHGGYGPMPRGLVAPVCGTSVGAFRLATDPLFYAALTLDNIVVGSRYRVTRVSNGEELATGVAASTSEVIAGLPVYSNPMQVAITVRNASGTPAYKVFNTQASMSREGASAYILQIED